MSGDTPAPVLCELTADAIDWTLPAAPTAASAESLKDLLVDALIEAQSYRLLAQEALHALRIITLQRDWARQSSRKTAGA